MPLLSQMLSFLQSPSFRQAQSTLIVLLAQCIVIGRTPQATSEIKINVKTVNNVLSFTISSSPRGEQSRVTDTVMMLVCVLKQATIKTISDRLYTPL